MQQVPHLYAPIKEGGLAELTELFKIERREVSLITRFPVKDVLILTVLGHVFAVRLLSAGRILAPILP